MSVELLLKKNRSENVIEYDSRRRSTLKKNLTRQEWNLKGDVETHVIYNFYCFYVKNSIEYRFL